LVVQALGGGMSITGDENGRPIRAGIPIGDLGGGLFAALGILAALNARNITGRDQAVDISMLDAQISLSNYMATMHLLSGEIPRPVGNSHFVHVPYDTFRTRTLDIVLAVITDGFWENLVEVLDVDALRSAQFIAQPGRLKARELITTVIQQMPETETCEYWLQKLDAARVPCAPVNDIAGALSDKQILARDMVVSVPHPQGGSVRMPGNPVKLSAMDNPTYTAPPRLGQQSRTILGELAGVTPADFDRLQAAGIVR
jgi:crotonobetainyl-CoA:carnitine CoA-transferase CaiB-like acyl-CoA transferase